MTLDKFVNKYNGKGIDFDGYYGFQCYDLAHQYAVECVGKDIPSKPAAKDLWDVDIDGYLKILNLPDNFPQKGDLVVWGTELGAWGHVAVAISGNADSFVSFDQNFPLGTLCHVQQHNYTGVLGWFRPNHAIIAQPIAQPVMWPDFTDQTIISAKLLNSQNFPVTEDKEIQQLRGLLSDHGIALRNLEAAEENITAKNMLIKQQTEELVNTREAYNRLLKEYRTLENDLKKLVDGLKTADVLFKISKYGLTLTLTKDE